MAGRRLPWHPSHRLDGCCAEPLPLLERSSSMRSEDAKMCSDAVLVRSLDCSDPHSAPPMWFRNARIFTILRSLKRIYSPILALGDILGVTLRRCIAVRPSDGSIIQRSSVCPANRISNGQNACARCNRSPVRTLRSNLIARTCSGTPWMAFSTLPSAADLPTRECINTTCPSALTLLLCATLCRSP